ncbi:hypothetical protein COV20_00230 [Candidatus Woesearchaeota archaeon CG10_big_fil_rev_8_21_14_0_10_45_16]|nr:MAG: hypothetical protein COV20_00230 [Candidatus Woesearchaeota archaeon CG10_big_fil_rev_8_21_14_0_10_45_16]
MYTLKRLPEDFIVKEISNITIEEKGRYLYFLLRKKNRNTLDIVKQLAKVLNLKEKQVGFAGSKDKNAVTEQAISVSGVGKEKVLGCHIENVELEFLGYGNEPISLGGLKGNRFEIIVRDLDPVEVEEIGFIENYFDEQRFSKNNKEIGKNLVKKDFKAALELIGNSHSDQHLAKNSNDLVGALKKISSRLLRMYLNAYQSYLWNETVKRHLERSFKEVKKIKYSLGELVFVKEGKDQDMEIPLIGFSEIKTDSVIAGIIKEVMAEERLSHRDFIIKQIPELTLEGEMRRVFVDVKEMSIGEFVKDDLNPGKMKVKVSFALPKGSYATMVIRKMFC